MSDSLTPPKGQKMPQTPEQFAHLAGLYEVAMKALEEDKRKLMNTVADLRNKYQSAKKRNKSLQAELAEKEKENKKLAKRIHNQRKALRDDWQIIEQRRKPWSLKFMAKLHKERKVLIKDNQQLKKVVKAAKKLTDPWSDDVISQAIAANKERVTICPEVKEYSDLVEALNELKDSED